MRIRHRYPTQPPNRNERKDSSSPTPLPRVGTGLGSSTFSLGDAQPISDGGAPSHGAALLQPAQVNPAAGYYGTTPEWERLLRVTERLRSAETHAEAALRRAFTTQLPRGEPVTALAAEVLKVLSEDGPSLLAFVKDFRPRNLRELIAFADFHATFARVASAGLGNVRDHLRELPGDYWDYSRVVYETLRPLVAASQKVFEAPETEQLAFEEGGWLGLYAVARLSSRLSEDTLTHYTSDRERTVLSLVQFMFGQAPPLLDAPHALNELFFAVHTTQQECGAILESRTKDCHERSERHRQTVGAELLEQATEMKNPFIAVALQMALHGEQLPILNEYPVTALGVLLTGKAVAGPSITEQWATVGLALSAIRNGRSDPATKISSMDEYRQTSSYRSVVGDMRNLRTTLLAQSGITPSIALLCALSVPQKRAVAAFHDPNVVVEALAETVMLTGGATFLGIRQLDVTDARAHYAGLSPRKGQRSVNLGFRNPDRRNEPDETRRVSFHEGGHAVEEHGASGLLQANVDWLLSRALSRAPRHLGPGYRPDEYGYRGRYHSLYVAKAYWKDDQRQERDILATEVLSTGLTQFTDPEAMLELYAWDSELFFHTLGELCHCQPSEAVG